MKTVVLFRNSTIQIVLTPETPMEKALLKEANVTDSDNVRVYKDVTFYSECRGGWIHQYSGEPEYKSIVIELKA